ncbi:unnamed protein product [Phaedon cochleariae]|uniref:Uncharacterized protein n=1 Tax=Phaedon cochleariae TaxID=80249 RepID=A0A9P0GI21_PHACE|nr:unnamed protein product [Phaedon cochleariae]
MALFRIVVALTIAFCNFVHSIPVGGNKGQLLRSRNNLRTNENYFTIQTSAGVEEHENGYLRGSDDQLDVSGNYSVSFKDGTVLSVNYTAGVGGFLARFHLDKPLPTVILKNRIPTAAIASLAGGGIG